MGIVLGLTNIGAPIHEWCHVASAGLRGIRAEVVDWNLAHVYGNDFRALVTAGWYGEMVIWFLLALVGIYAGGRFPIFTGGFSVGYMLATWGRGFTSYDFHEGVANYVSHYPLSATLKAGAIAYYTDRVLTGWAALGLVCIAAGVALSWWQIKKRGRRK